MAGTAVFYMNPEFVIRTIRPGDDPFLAAIIRNTLEEFGANKPGTVYFDGRTDHLSDEFSVAGSVYFVLEKNDQVMGGGGIYPTENLPPGTCELVKLYLSPAARGLGYGRLLLEKCLEAAIHLGYRTVYLESMPELTIAIPLYERTGFRYLDRPQGNSGHDGCSVWMIRELY